jgi:Na+/proline symporter
MFDLNIVILFLLGYFAVFYGFSRYFQNFGSTKDGYLVANRNAGVFESTLAVIGCWLTALGFMVSGQQFYNNGWIGLFWFTIPQLFGMLIMGWLTFSINRKIPNGYTISKWIRDDYGTSVAVLFQLAFVFASFGNLTMTFTTLFKYIKFIDIGNAPLITFIILAGTVLYSIKGGLKTSLQTGAIQTLINIVLIATIIYFGLSAIPEQSLADYTNGVKNITDIFDPTLMKTFAITAFLTLITGPLMSSTHHQKAFAQQNKSPWKAWALGAPGYVIVEVFAALLGLIAFTLGVKADNLSTMQFTFAQTLGLVPVALLGVIMLNITCIVIDSHGNGAASIIANDFIKDEKNSVFVSKVALAGLALLSWIVALYQFDLTYILFTYGIVRMNLFIILIGILLSDTLFTKRGVFWAGVIMTPITVTLGIYAMNNKIPDLNVTASILAMFWTPLMAFILSKLMKEKQ